MIEFGETLRAAREAKGLTTRQIAEKTHMMVQMVENLENENFSKIVAPIYGRGFIKLYCEAVEIDPKPLIAEFMDIYNGNREPTIRMRESKPAQTPPPPPPPLPPPVKETETLFTSEPIKEQPAPVIEKRPTEPLSFRLESEHTETSFRAPPSRYAAPMPIDEPREPISLKIPPAIWRLAALACVAGLILWICWMGLAALYRATMGTSETEAALETPLVETAPRQPISLPPLYID